MWRAPLAREGLSKNRGQHCVRATHSTKNFQKRLVTKESPTSGPLFPVIVSARLLPTTLHMNCSFRTFREFVFSQEGQDVAEYAIMLAVVLVIVMGTVTAIASNAGVVFSGVASSIP